MSGKSIQCPLCGSNDVDYRGEETTHIWVCEECPFVGFEFYADSDLENLKKVIK